MVLTEKQAELLRQQAEVISNWRDDDDLKYRENVALQMTDAFHRLGIPQGNRVDSRSLCELVALQRQVQDLDPIPLRRFLGGYNYKVHFGGYRGTRKEFLAERREKPGDSAVNEGADLTQVSAALQLMSSDETEQQTQGATQLFAMDNAGQALVSGFLHLLHPTRYGLVNSVTKQPFQNTGCLSVGEKQRKEAGAASKEKYDESKKLPHKVHQFLLRWEVLFDEVRTICRLDTYHEVHQFLWAVSSEPPSEEHDEKVKAAVAKISEENSDLRKAEEHKARKLIEQNLGRLTADQFSAVLTHINASLGPNGITYTRFSPAFVGNNANLLIKRVDELNVWISKLWQAKEAELPGLLTQFWEEKFAGGGRSFPTAILYLRNPEFYCVWTSNLENALYSITPGVLSKRRTGFSYLQYCRAVQKIRKRYDFTPQMHDFVLFRLGLELGSDPIPPASDFTGFTGETFEFMADLAENNNQTWFEENRQRFKDHVDRPLRVLVSELGKELISSLDPRLETSAKSNKCLSRIRKNIYGKKEENVYHEWFWAAFYRRELTKISDCQLSISIRSGWLQHGFYFGDQADSVREHFQMMLEEYPEIGEAVFARLKEDDFLFAKTEKSGEHPEPIQINDFDEFRQLFKKTRVHVYRRLSDQEAVEKGAAVKFQMASDFRSLHPLFKLATLPAPDADLLELVEGTADEIAGDEITLADLEADTFLKESFFEMLEQYLADKQQLIFDGPPGTGKTFVARKWADYLCQGGGEARTIQFHPSYAYEDFIEGLRPTTTTSGALVYKVEDGIFKRLCDRARTNPDARFVLVIDEINRGNIPRIFGELMFLLEHRGETTDLPYSKSPFSIPKNVIILGTMNTTDRSIALFDLALRRRFHSVPMEPRSDILLRWLVKNDKPRLICELFDRLNERLAKTGIEPARLVGHSHFMSPQIDEDYLSLIWDGTIIPLIMEYFFAEPDKVAEFYLDAFMESVETNEDDESDNDDEPDSEQDALG